MGVLPWSKHKPPPTVPAPESDLLHQVVHPLFADMPDPKVEWIMPINPLRRKRRSLSAPRSSSSVSPAPRDPQALPNVAGVIQEIATGMREELQAPAHRRGGGARVTAPKQAPEVVLAALSVALLLACVEKPLLLTLRISRRSDRRPLLDAWRKWSGRARLDAPHWGPMRPRHGGYRWLKEDNAPFSRLERLAAAFVTLRQAARLWSVTDLVNNTQLLAPLCLRPAARCICTVLWHSRETVLEIAARRAQQGKRVVAISAGSAYHVGGGFLTGGRHALEEAMCMQSTLFFSLQRAAQKAQERDLRDAQGNRIHIPEDGAILSPGVEVFRDGTAAGYAPCAHGRTWLAAVISVAMPNMNPNMTDCPTEHRSKSAMKTLVERKLHAVLQGAARVDAEVIVVPDIGCGVYGNHPSVIGSAFGRVLCGYHSYFSEVIVTGSDEFFNEVHEEAGPQFVVMRREPRDTDGVCRTACEVVRSVSGLNERQVSSWFCCGCSQGLRKASASFFR